MKTIMAVLGACGLGSALLACAVGAGGVGATSADGVLLGTFDSRAVAIAYYNSPPFQEELAEAFAELEAAKAAADTERVAELEAYGSALQESMHAQGFSTAPVDDILARIESELPAIARAAGVDVIVSEWQLVYRALGAQAIDVTMALVDALKPDAKGRKAALEIMEQEPAPMGELAHDH